jgi:hypothetical protein
MNEQEVYVVFDPDSPGEPDSPPSASKLLLWCAIVFAVVYAVVRFGGWHQQGNPLNDPTFASSETALICAFVCTGVFAGWQYWKWR